MTQGQMEGELRRSVATGGTILVYSCAVFRIVNFWGTGELGVGKQQHSEVVSRQ
jgi:hypothetical protein